MRIGLHHFWLFLLPTASVLGASCAPSAMELRSEDQRLVVQAPDEQRIPLALRGQLLSLRKCYAAALGKLPRLTGSLELSVTFHAKGTVKTFSSSSKLPPFLKRCLQERILRWRLGAQESERRFGPYVLTFEPRRGTPLTASGRPQATAHVGTPDAPRRPARSLRPRAARARRVVRIRGALSSYVPPVPLGASVGARVRAKIRARIYGLRRCYNRALINDRCLSGLVDLAFTISTEGHPGNITVTSAMPEPVVRCIRGKVQRWRLGAIPRAVPYGPFRVRFRSLNKCP